MKISTNLPNVDHRIRKEARFILFSSIFGGITLSELCKSVGIHHRQLYRALNGESSYRNQSYIFLILIAELPYSDIEAIEEANRLLDEIEQLVADHFIEGDETNG